MKSNEDVMDNGFILSSYFMPEEVLTRILSFLNQDTLVHHCRYVCRVWNDIIIDKDIWKLKLLRSKVSSLSNLSAGERKQLVQRFHPHWYLYFWILNGVPFGRNLLRNNCGQSKLEHWEVTEPTADRGFHQFQYSLGDRYWDVEPQPADADPIPNHDDFGMFKSCFSTSYVRCVKRQIIDLRKEGFPTVMIDKFQPPITISEWYAGRYDCGCTYTLRAFLLGECNQVLMNVDPIEKQRAQWESRKWNKVESVIENYSPGVRYIVFEHEGKDTQFWAGNYGSKMAGGIVKISLPKSLPE